MESNNAQGPDIETDYFFGHSDPAAPCALLGDQAVDRVDLLLRGPVVG